MITYSGWGDAQSGPINWSAITADGVDLAGVGIDVFVAVEMILQACEERYNWAYSHVPIGETPPSGDELRLMLYTQWQTDDFWFRLSSFVRGVTGLYVDPALVESAIAWASSPVDNGGYGGFGSRNQLMVWTIPALVAATTRPGELHFFNVDFTDFINKVKPIQAVWLRQMREVIDLMTRPNLDKYRLVRASSGTTENKNYYRVKLADVPSNVTVPTEAFIYLFIQKLHLSGRDSYADNSLYGAVGTVHNFGKKTVTGIEAVELVTTTGYHQNEHLNASYRAWYFIDPTDVKPIFKFKNNGE